MKLIDADKLKTHLWDRYCHYACNGSDLNKAAALNVGLGAVEVQEEIEAIPISWIEKKIEKSKEFPASDDISDCYQLNISEVWEWLLDDWRKENED